MIRTWRFSVFPGLLAMAAGLVLLAPVASSRAAELGQDLGRPEQDPGQALLLLQSPVGEVTWLSHITVSGVGLADAVAALMPRLQGAGHRLIVTVDPMEKGTLAPPGYGESVVTDWAADLRQGVAQMASRVVAVAPGLGHGHGPRDARWDAFVLKQAAVAVRAARPDVQVVLPLRGGPGQDAWLKALYQQGVEPYVDVWALHLEPGDPVPGDEEFRLLDQARRRLDPGAPLWVLGLPVDQAGAASMAALVGRLATAGAGALTFRVDRDVAAATELEHLRAILSPAATAMPAAKLLFQSLDGSPLEQIQAWSFFDADRSHVGVLVVPTAPAPSFVQMILPTFDVSSPTLVDLSTGARRDLGGGLPDRQRNRTLVTLTDLSGPVVVDYERFATPGFAREDVLVDRQRDPSVEEILARHQEVAVAAAARVESVLADARIDFHYTIAGSGASIDVAYDSRYMWDRETGAEFEYMTMYINGARWTRDKMPDLPLIQPEKVLTPPLKIAMGREYVYRLQGRDRVEGRPAWRIGFQPRDAQATRYSGTAWIDRESYRLLKQSVVQTGLRAPVLASEETSLFAAYPVPGGGDAYLPRRITGQQQWNVAGTNFLVNREVRFTNIRINEPGFAEQRREAYASPHQILRETDQGLRYLEPGQDGERVLMDKVRTRSLFLVGGGFYNEAVDFPIPFAGLDYFDYDFLGRGQQINLFLAGAANLLTWADPALGGSRVDLSADLSLVGFAGADRFFVMGDEREDAEIKSRSQSLSATLGVPLGHFLKFRGTYGLRYENFQAGEDMAADFIQPQDTLVPFAKLELQFNRRGFSATADVSGFHRVDWEVWGDPDPGSDLVGSRVGDFSADHQDFTRWSFSVSQDFFLKAFQKVRLSATWLDGSDLDRFSRYQFSFFGEKLRLRGFSGSGVRFDQGVLARVRYTFNLADVVTFDAGVDHGRVENFPGGEGYQNHTGIGFAGKFLGPWGLIVKLEYGYALRSDIKAVEGEQEVQLLFLKIF